MLLATIRSENRGNKAVRPTVLKFYKEVFSYFSNQFSKFKYIQASTDATWFINKATFIRSKTIPTSVHFQYTPFLVSTRRCKSTKYVGERETTIHSSHYFVFINVQPIIEWQMLFQITPMQVSAQLLYAMRGKIQNFHSTTYTSNQQRRMFSLPNSKEKANPEQNQSISIPHELVHPIKRFPWGLPTGHTYFYFHYFRNRLISDHLKVRYQVIMLSE